jgi:hypothetical protein
MQNTIAKLKDMLPAGTGSQLFNNIDTGLGLAQTPEQKMNVLNHFGGEIQNQLLPLIHLDPATAAQPTQSSVGTPADLNPMTASAQVGHPILSINGTDLRPPGQTTIGGSKIADPPMSPKDPTDQAANEIPV